MNQIIVNKINKTQLNKCVHVQSYLKFIGIEVFAWIYFNFAITLKFINIILLY